MGKKVPGGTSRRPVWAEQLLGLAKFTRDERPREEFWVLLNLVIAQRMIRHSRRLGSVSKETLQDLASQKALELVGKLDCGQWKPLESSPGELVSFLSTVARNALVDELRRPGRLQGKMEELDPEQPRPRSLESVTAPVEQRDFVSAFVACAGRLKPEHRTIWLFRVLYEMPSSAIARHPEVRLKPPHVDVVIGRCRHQIRECLERRGIDARHLVPGTYSELWRAFRSDGAQSRSSSD